MEFVSLYSGCGGSSLGYVLSGMNGVLAVDYNEICCLNYNINFPKCTIWNKDVSKLSPNEILEFLNKGVGNLDFLDCSPPCQGFSVAGNRRLHDERNSLLLDTCRIINGLKPKVFLIENVEGLIKGKMKGVFNHLYSNLSELGYNLKWKSLNSIYYGVPQSRQRVFIIGYRSDLGLFPNFPVPESNIVLIGDVIDNLDFHSRGQFDKRLKNKYSLAYTLTKTPSMYFVKNGVKLKPTIEELKILQGFPDWFKFEGSYTDIWGLIGNSVPPPLSYRLGKIIKQDILNLS